LAQAILTQVRNQLCLLHLIFDRFVIELGSL